VQSALLPSQDPEVEGLDVAGTCTPANEVGGDYFDYFQFPDGRFGVAVGDVSGKGVPAAFCMTLTKGFMEVAASEAREPATVLGLANGHLRANLTRGTFVTMAYAVVDPESRVVTCARAGHNPPAILRDGVPPEFLSGSGTALGAAPEEQFNELIESVRVELRRGDTLVFYTDGVTEAMNGAREQFGEERLLETLERLRDGRTARGLVDGLLGEIESYASDADQHDDITVVVIRAE
jgi:phosphoserine phosphatase RsbU/P